MTKYAINEDVGHATTSNYGQGGAQALEDAYYLENMISAKSGDEKVFEKFQKKRFKKVNKVVRQSLRFGKVAHWRYGATFRGLFIASLPDSMMKKT